jgi:Flp pilus assembly protein TadD
VLTNLDKMCALKPEAAPIWSGRGMALHQLGRHEEAVASFIRGRDIDPESPISLGSFFANSLIELKRYDEAEAVFNQLLKERPNDAELWFNGAMQCLR